MGATNLLGFVYVHWLLDCDIMCLTEISTREMELVNIHTATAVFKPNGKSPVAHIIQNR